jgi:hypothetical protein
MLIISFPHPPILTSGAGSNSGNLWDWVSGNKDWVWKKGLKGVNMVVLIKNFGTKVNIPIIYFMGI